MKEREIEELKSDLEMIQSGIDELECVADDIQDQLDESAERDMGWRISAQKAQAHCFSDLRKERRALMKKRAQLRAVEAAFEANKKKGASVPLAHHEKQIAEMKQKNEKLKREKVAENLAANYYRSALNEVVSDIGPHDLEADCIMQRHLSDGASE